MALSPIPCYPGFHLSGLDVVNTVLGRTMPSPSSDSPGFPPAHVGDRSSSSFSMIEEDVLEPNVAQSGVSSPTPLMLRLSRRINEQGVSPSHRLANAHGWLKPQSQSMSDVSSPIQAALRSPSNTIEQNNPPRYSLTTTRELPKPKPSSAGYEGQLEVITGVAIVAIHVQLLSVVVASAARTLLSIGLILELLGILLAICFVRTHNGDNIQPRSTLTRLTLRMPTFLIFMGIVGLGATLVVETLQTSLGTAVTMSSFLIFGVIICILTLLRDLRTAERGESGGGYGYSNS